MFDKPRRLLLTVCAAYATWGILWILLSDRALALLPLSAGQLGHLQTYKGLAFVLITTGLLYAGLRHQLERWVAEQRQRRNAEAAQHQTEQKMRAIFDLSFEFIALLRKDGTLLEANDRTLDFARVSAEAVLGKPFWETPWWRHSPEEQARLKEAVARAAKGELVRMELTQCAPDGRLICVDHSLKPVRDESGEVMWLISEGRDITERKATEQALRESESHFRQLSDSLPQLVWTCTADGKCDFLSGQWLRFTGVPLEEQLGTGWLKLVHPEDRPHLAKAWAEAQATETVFRTEIRMRRRDGVYRWFDDRAVPLRGADGRIMKWFGSNTEIHDERELLEAVRISEAKLRTIFEAEPECLKLLEPDGTAHEINAAGLRILEADVLEEVVGRSLLEFVISEDRPEVEKLLSVAAQGERDQLEFRIVGLKGTPRWLEMHVAPFHDPQSAKALILCVSREVTERKQTEEALSLSKERLRACIENTPNVAVQWYDEQGRVVFWNHASERLFGWRADEALGKTPFQLTQTAEQMERFLRTIQTIKQTGEKIGPLESAFRRRDGTQGVCLSTMFSIPFDSLTPCFVSMDVDVTEHNQAQEQTRQSLSLLQATLEATADGILVVNANGRITSYNRKFIAMWRLPENVLAAGNDVAALTLAKEQLLDPDNFLGDVENIYKLPETASFDVISFKDGRTFERHSHPQRLNQQIVGRVWSFRDVTERKRAERLVVQSELRLRLVWENALLAMRLADAAGTVLLVNNAYCQIMGKSRGELEGEPFTIAYAEKFRMQALADYVVRFENREKCVQRATEVICWNGRRAQLEVSDVFLELSGQQPLLLTIVNDITANVQIERRARIFGEMARKLSGAATRRAAADIIAEAAHQLLGWDACFLNLFENDKDRVESLLMRDTIGGKVMDVAMTKGCEYASELVLDVLRGGEKLILRPATDTFVPGLVSFGDLNRRSASLMFVPIRETGRPVGVLSIQSYTANAYDETGLATLRSLADHCTGAFERLRAVENLGIRERQFRSLIENASDLITVVNFEGLIRYQSPSAQRLLGYKPEEMTGRNLVEFIHPDDTPAAVGAIHAAVAEPHTSATIEYRLRHHNGSWRRIQSIGRNTPEYSEGGGIIFNSRDITESRALEEQFRQSQKMEAIGQLAGGVAHDFNNLLAVIQMQVELLKLEVNLSPEQKESTNEIGNAALRAANLTRQLLMFSRRQALQPRNLNLNEIVANVATMLQRLLGEDVRTQLTYSPEPLHIHADSMMIDQIMLNLAVNARDAMPRGGSLLIETSKAEFDSARAALVPQARPGIFACLSVADTGVGIAPEILPRIFEPFFTTKDVGKGTGLGLATVFGLVQQHQGWINVQSEVAVGTIFRVYLPLLVAKTPTDGQETTLATVKRGTETILLVEDEPALRSLVRTVLTRLGYRVLEAPSGFAALEVWKAHRDEIKLLLTDLVMPDGVSGRDLSQRLLGENPQLKVIYTSGYSQEIAGPDFPLHEGENFLAKPFQAIKLAKVVRERLDS